MAEIGFVADLVRRHWLSQGLQVSPIGAGALTGLRRIHPDGLPHDYEILLSTAGLPENEDGQGFRFWLPHEVRPTGEVLKAGGYESDAAESSVIIADYLQESWWYALWLDGPFAGRVSLVLGRRDGKDPQPPIGGVADFLIAYVNDDECLYPPESNHRKQGIEPGSGER